MLLMWDTETYDLPSHEVVKFTGTEDIPEKCCCLAPQATVKSTFTVHYHLKTNDYASGSLGFKTGNNKWG
jgi:hypothetical protein